MTAQDSPFSTGVGRSGYQAGVGYQGKTPIGEKRIGEPRTVPSATHETRRGVEPRRDIGRMSAADFTFQPNVRPHIAALMFPTGAHIMPVMGGQVWLI